MFKRNNSKNSAVSQAGLAELALKNIHDGVIITDKSGLPIKPPGWIMVYY